MLANCDVIVIFWNYGQFGAIRKPDSRRIVRKTYFHNSNTAVILLICVKVLFLPKMMIFCKKNADIRKIKVFLVLKVYFLELNVCVLTYQISSPLPPQNEPLKSPPRLGLNE